MALNDQQTPILRNIHLNRPDFFIFEVVFDYSKGFDPHSGALCLDGRSVVVEVEEERMARFMGSIYSREADRHSAAETAQQAALETIQKDLPEGFIPACAVAPLHHLPSELRRRRPTLHTNRAYAWLV